MAEDFGALSLALGLGLGGVIPTHRLSARAGGGTDPDAGEGDADAPVDEGDGGDTGAGDAGDGGSDPDAGEGDADAPVDEGDDGDTGAGDAGDGGTDPDAGEGDADAPVDEGDDGDTGAGDAGDGGTDPDAGEGDADAPVDEGDDGETGDIGAPSFDIEVSGNVVVFSAARDPDVVEMEIEITEPDAFAGTYTVQIADLASGPVCLSPPVVMGERTWGETLSVRPGLWITTDQFPFDGGPSFTWLRNGAVDASIVHEDFVQLGRDRYDAFAVIETRALAVALGSVSAASATVAGAVPAPSILSPLAHTHIDISDPTTLFQGMNLNTPASVEGHRVGLVYDRSGAGYHLVQGATEARPTLRFDEAGRRFLEFRRDPARFLQWRTQSSDAANATQWPTSGAIGSRIGGLLDGVARERLTMFLAFCYPPGYAFTATAALASLVDNGEYPFRVADSSTGSFVFRSVQPPNVATQLSTTDVRPALLAGPSVLRASVDTVARRQTIAVNGQVVIENTNHFAAGALRGNDIRRVVIGARHDGGSTLSWTSDIRLYAAALVLGDMTAQQIADIEGEMAYRLAEN